DECGLAHYPVPEFFRQGPEPDAQATDDHEQQPPGRKFVLTGQHIFQNLKHVLFLTGQGPDLFVSKRTYARRPEPANRSVDLVGQSPCRASAWITSNFAGCRSKKPVAYARQICGGAEERCRSVSAT